MRDRIEVVAYNPQWNEEFKKESRNLKRVFVKNIRGVYHIGGTAIKGMSARPIIDIMVTVKAGTLNQIPYDELNQLGYDCTESERFFKSETDPMFQLLVFEETNVKEVRRHLALAGFLTAKKEEMKLYDEQKTSLAEQYAQCPEEYASHKKEVLDALEFRAMEWQARQEELGKHMSMGMCLGTAVGCGVGYVCFDMIVGMLIGAVIGSAVGYLYGRKKGGE